jgi:hypothetical protein
MVELYLRTGPKIDAASHVRAAIQWFTCGLVGTSQKSDRSQIPLPRFGKIDRAWKLANEAHLRSSTKLKKMTDNSFARTRRDRCHAERNAGLAQAIGTDAIKV